jgi:hypothetical protein
MATESTFVYDESFTAGEDLSSAQFYIVSSSAAGAARIATNYTFAGGSVHGIGVLQNNPSSNQAATVRLLGKSKIVASSSGSISVGSWVTVSATTTYNGRAIAATTGMYVIGKALTASTGAAGHVIECLLTGPQYLSGGTTA